MNEIWKSIPDFDGWYEASNLGRIRRVKPGRSTFIGRICQTHKSRDGYLRVHLFMNGERCQELVHRLVASAFIPNPSNRPHINHKNGIKSDNSLDNMEWATAAENIKHACQTGLNPPNSGAKNGNAKLTRQAVESIRKSWVPFRKTAKMLAEEYGVSLITVRRILNGKSWIS